jgi:hypothetical protein
MENQARYDLSAAIESWRQELAAQAGLTAEVRRELETHLRDAVAGFQQRGLNDEESFWLARRRVGQPQQLGVEFVKVDPAKVWRERVFWMAIGLLVMQLWSDLSLFLTLAIQSISSYAIRHDFFLPDWVWYYLPSSLQWNLASVLRSPILSILARFVPLIWIAVLLAKGRMNYFVSKLELLFKLRSRFVFMAATLFALYYSWMIYVTWNYSGKSPGGRQLFSVSFLVQRALGWSFVVAMLVALIAWLLPTQKQNTPKQA